MKRLHLLLLTCTLHLAAFSQNIEVAPTSQDLPIIPGLYDHSQSILNPGMHPFGNGTYTDSLVNYLDTIIQTEPEGIKIMPVYKAVWNRDTLSYKQLPPVWRTYNLDSKNKKKYLAIEVESLVPPHTRFTANIEGLTESEIAALTDSMQHMKGPQDTLTNSWQTCIFYALEALFRTHGICPDPVITRSTNFVTAQELPAFCNYFLSRKADYPCRYKKVKEAVFPDDCMLVIVNGFGDIIHAVFYHNRLFYSKNGYNPPEVYNTLLPVLRMYGQADSSTKGLNKTGKQLKGAYIRVYTLDPKKFSSLPRKKQESCQLYQ